MEIPIMFKFLYWQITILPQTNLMFVKNLSNEKIQAGLTNKVPEINVSNTTIKLIFLKFINCAKLFRNEELTIIPF